MPSSKLRYPDPPGILKGRLNWRALKYFGAGAILASVTIGSGETLMASRGGSIFGYALLWCVLLAVVTKGVQVYTAARYMTLTGEHPLEHWAHFPGPPKWIPAMLCALSLWCFPFLLAFLTLVLGQIINEMFHVATPDEPAKFLFWTRVWATCAAVVAITLTLLQSYRVMEIVQTSVIGLLLVSIGAACVASNPDWIAAIGGLLIPVAPHYEPWVLEKYAEKFADRTPWVEVTAIVGFVGGGAYDYLGYVGCLREKNWGAIGLNDAAAEKADSAANANISSALPKQMPTVIDSDDENVYRGRRWLLPSLIDVTASFACVFVFSVCFVVLGAAVLNPQEIIPAKDGELLTHQAQFLTRFHPSLLYLYQVGVFMAFWGTIYGAYELYSRTIYECLRPLSERLKRAEPHHVRVYVVLYCGIFGIALTWLTVNPISLITFPSLLGGVLTCGLWCFGMIWLDFKFIPARLRMNKFLLVATVLSGLALSLLGFKALLDYASSFIGYLTKS